MQEEAPASFRLLLPLQMSPVTQSCSTASIAQPPGLQGTSLPRVQRGIEGTTSDPQQTPTSPRGDFLPLKVTGTASFSSPTSTLALQGQPPSSQEDAAP